MVKPATGTTTTTARAPSLPSQAPTWTSERYRLLADRVARWVIGLGGIGIVAVILAILVVLLVEVAPLFQAPAARLLGTVTAPAVAVPAKIGVDEYREVAYFADLSGVKMISLKDGAELSRKPAPSLDQDSIAAVSGISQGKLAFATRAGKIIFCEVKF